MIVLKSGRKQKNFQRSPSKDQEKEKYYTTSCVESFGSFAFVYNYFKEIKISLHDDYLNGYFYNDVELLI